MSQRTPSDNFTRFTSTSPYASSKPTESSSFSYQPPSSKMSNVAPPRDETPKEKVARLRAAALAEKARRSMSPIDRMINRGRIIADATHRIVAYSLIGLTGVASVVAVYSLFSLVSHNRRQKRAWIEREMQRLRDAQTAFLAGTATAEQLHLLEQERAGEEIVKQHTEAQRRKKENSIWSMLKNSIGGTGSMGRETEGTMHKVKAGGERLLEEGWVAEPGSLTGSRGGVLEAVAESRREAERDIISHSDAKGGPLDQLANNVASAVAPSTDRSWMSWSRGWSK